MCGYYGFEIISEYFFFLPKFVYEWVLNVVVILLDFWKLRKRFYNTKIRTYSQYSRADMVIVAYALAHFISSCI